MKKLEMIRFLKKQAKKDFIMSGHKFESIDCPECKAELLIVMLDWWEDLEMFGEKINKKKK